MPWDQVTLTCSITYLDILCPLNHIWPFGCPCLAHVRSVEIRNQMQMSALQRTGEETKLGPVCAVGLPDGPKRISLSMHSSSIRMALLAQWVCALISSVWTDDIDDLL